MFVKVTLSPFFTSEFNELQNAYTLLSEYQKKILVFLKARAIGVDLFEFFDFSAAVFPAVHPRPKRTSCHFFLGFPPFRFRSIPLFGRNASGGAPIPAVLALLAVSIRLLFFLLNRCKLMNIDCGSTIAADIFSTPENLFWILQNCVM